MTEPARSGRRPRRHLIVHLLVYPPVCLALLVVLLQLALNSPTVQEQVRAALTRAIPGTISYERMSLSLLPPRVHLHGVRLAHPTSGRALITAGEVLVSYKGSLRHPGRDGVALGDITVLDGSLELLFDEQGNLSLLDLFVSPGSEEEEVSDGSPPRVSLENVEVRNLRFLLHIPEAGLTIEAEETQVRQGKFLMENGEMSIDSEVSIPSGRVRISGGPPGQPGSTSLDIPVDGLELRGFSWRGQSFSAREAQLVSDGVTARVVGGMCLDGPGTFWGTTELRLPFEHWFLAPLLDGALAGTAEVQGSFHGTLEEARGAFMVQAPALRVAGIDLTGVLVQGGLQGQEIQLARVQAGLLGGSAELSGALRLLDGTVQGRATLHRVATDTLLPAGAAREAAAGLLGGRLSAAASLWADGPLAATVEADLQLKRAEGKASLPLPQLLRLRTRGRIAGQRIELADLQLQGGGHALATRGWLDLERQSFDLAVELASGALAPVLAGFGLQGLDGRASFAGRVQGRVDDPRVQGQLAVQQLQLLGLQLGRIDCALTLQQGTLSLGGLRSQGSWGVLRLDGRLGLWRRSVAEPIADPPVQLSGRLEEMDLAMLLPQALRGKGKLGAELSARGSLDHLDAELSVQAGNVELVGLGLDHFTLQATAMRDGALLGVKVPRLDLALQHGGGLVASGELRSDRTFTLDLRAEGLPVAELDRLTGLKRGLSGKVTFGLHGEGPLLAPRVSGDLLLRGLQMELPAAEEEDAPRRYAFGDASLHLELGEDQRLRIGSGKAFGFFDLAAELPVTLSARTPVALEQATARVTFAELALEQLVPGLAEREVQGKLTGGVTVTLPDGNPSILLEISRVELDVLGQQLSNRPAARPAAASGPAGAAGEALPLRFAFDGRQLRIEQLALQSGGRPLALAGTVTLDADGDTEATALDLRASGELDLAMLRPFLPDLPRLGGTLDFQLTLGGSLAAPQLVGFLGVQGAGFQLAALGQELALERGRILFLPGKIAIPGSAPLVGRLGRRGAFSLTAEVEVPRLWPPLVPSARLTLHGERLRISLPDEGMMLMLDIPQVELAATDVLAPERHIEVSGEVRLAQGQLNRSYTDPEELAAAFRGWFEGLEQTQSRGLPKGHPLQALRLRNLKIAGEQGALQVQVQAAILSLRLHLKPDLALTGPLESLRITGSVETQEDDAITLMDREFRLTHSDIRFDGSTSPLVEMEAEAQVIAAPLGGPSAQQHEATAFSAADEEERTYHITLLLEGRLPDDLEKFELTSPQTSDQRELWTLLLLGYRYSDLTRSGQRGDVGSEVLLSSALQILSQKISEKALKQFQLVDQLQLLSQHQDVKVQVSKKVLGGKLELLGSGTFSGQAETQGSLGAKLYLRERLFLEFSTTQDHEQNPMSSRLGWQVPLD